MIFYDRYDKSPEYGNKDDIEGVLLSKKLELITAECNLATLDGKVTQILNLFVLVHSYWGLPGDISVYS